MKILKVLLFVILFVPLSAQSFSGITSPEPLVIQHQLKITLNPKTGELRVRDTITLPDNGQSAFKLKLNSLFHLSYKKRPLHPIRTANGVSSYHLAVDESRRLTLRYKGKPGSTINCSWLREACVLLNENGVFLDGNSHWYPDVEGALHRFSMEVSLPKSGKQWVSLSQGRQTAKGWQEDTPQQTIYLLAGPFQVYESQPDPEQPKAMVLLQTKDPELARQYLDASHQYLAQYSRMLGPYPYAKFATVESFWETGWGMPSFTLLGSRVMRLPFILHSSFPHEILHNWWGNSVYVDSGEGNWSEGLTAYLADHHNKLNHAQRAAYRREALQKYQAFTAGGSDFPLRRFRGRHDRTTQTIGYDKSLMVFHMLRKRLGDQQFFRALKAFYRDYQFRSAGFKELQKVFESQTKQDLVQFFNQWLDKTSAPQVMVSNLQVKTMDTKGSDPNNPLSVQFTLKQLQTGLPFSVDIPIKIRNNNGNINHQTLHMNQREQHYALQLPESTRQIMIDPDFDLLRLPKKSEVPPALNTLFNRQPKTYVLPRKATNEMKKAWRDFSAIFAYGQSNMPLQFDDSKIPAGDIVVLLGKDNAMINHFSGMIQQPFELKEQALMVSGTRYPYNTYTTVLTWQLGTQQIILVTADTAKALQGLARKLPHYGKYSYVLFDNATTKNVAKGQWPVINSPMTLQLKVK
ncbi:MAG: M1 family metallopeptidase [Thiolinea sp.]